MKHNQDTPTKLRTNCEPCDYFETKLVYKTPEPMFDPAFFEREIPMTSDSERESFKKQINTIMQDIAKYPTAELSSRELLRQTEAVLRWITQTPGNRNPNGSDHHLYHEVPILMATKIKAFLQNDYNSLFKEEKPIEMTTSSVPQIPARELIRQCEEAFQEILIGIEFGRCNYYRHHDLPMKMINQIQEWKKLTDENNKAQTTQDSIGSAPGKQKDPISIRIQTLFVNLIEGFVVLTSADAHRVALSVSSDERNNWIVRLGDDKKEFRSSQGSLHRAILEVSKSISEALCKINDRSNKSLREISGEIES